MEELQVFFMTYGWQLGLIALGGIILLGILKYANAFSKIEKEKRKPIYFAFSIGFSLIATIIYLSVVGLFEVGYLITITLAIYMLNQTMYAVYEQTKLRDLLNKILNYFLGKLKDKLGKLEDKAKEQ